MPIVAQNQSRKIKNIRPTLADLIAGKKINSQITLDNSTLGIGIRACANESAHKRRYDAVLDIPLKQNSMVWIVW
jgi:hypothetical protein